MTAKICLNMIVRDEVEILERALRAAAPWIDCWAIHDTGSTDGTQALIFRVMDELGVPGRLSHGHFENFSQARNEALEAALDSGMDFDWLLLQDADMELVVDDSKWRNRLSGPSHRVTQRTDDLSYRNIRLLNRRDAAEAEYHGPTHEYLQVVGSSDFNGISFLDHACGSSRAEKFDRDVRLLAKAVENDPEDSRSVFYLAQSHRDSGRSQDATYWYHNRVRLGGWDEEVWYSKYQIAKLTGLAGDYLEAWNHRPTRAEPLVDLAGIYRARQQWHLAHLMSKKAVGIVRPDDLLFLDEPAYSWRALDEYAVASYWVGDHTMAAWSCRRLLGLRALPEDHRARVEANLAFANAKQKRR